MNEKTNGLDGIYHLSKLLITNQIKLSAWSQNGQRELLALYLGNGDLLYYYFTDENPMIKQIPWFVDPVHTPVSLAFNPSGTFLLVLSRSCHLYVVPALSFLDSKVKSDQTFDVQDLTIHTYPFPVKLSKPLKTETKSPSSSLSMKCSLSRQSSSSSISSNENPRRKSSSSCSNSIESKVNENIAKLKEVAGQVYEIAPTVVVWWQCILDCQHVAIIGTQSGDVIFVDLNTGVKLGETAVKGEIKGLSICQDNSLDTVFLLITIENNEQYKLVLEQKHLCYIWPGKPYPSSSEENENIEGMNLVASGRGNYLPSARARLQGLKKLSEEKLATLKQKIAETRSKMKQGSIIDSQKIEGAPVPENLGSTVGDTLMSPQFSRERYVLAGYHSPSQLLTVHSMALDIVPLFIHKMPIETDELMLCDRIIYVVSRNRTLLQIVSCHLSETTIEPSSDFNPESILGKWDFGKINCGQFSANKSDDKSSIVKPDLIPDDLLDENVERIINIYKSHYRRDSYNITEEYNIEKTKEELPTFPKVENCIVVTNRCVYIVELKSNVIKIALDLILKTQELEKAERICKIFGINLQQLLELAGDIKLAALEFPKAIALYKLSKCGLLKSIAKLSCGGHCSQVLSYSTMLLTTTISDMTLSERIHLSNLVLLAYTQQILKNDNNRGLTDKFLDFLEKNIYYDEILAVSVTGQSQLYLPLHKLITYKGLVLDGYNVLVKLMNRFLRSESLHWATNKTQFWDCATEPTLIEAMVFKSLSFPIYIEFINRNLDSLEIDHLNRLLILSDPTSFFIRPLAKVTRSSEDASADNEYSFLVFPFHKLVELFLCIILTKISKTKVDEDYNRELLLPIQETANNESSSVINEAESIDESLTDHIWPIRKDIQADERSKKKDKKILSCGYGHTALIRNGNVYTWGQTAKGCLGHGPTMSRHASPLPVTWLGCFKLEVSIVSCGKFHTAALTNNGVYTWGDSLYGQLGLGELHESPHPRLVPALARENVVAVSCGQYHTLALTYQGSVFAWGWGVHGQLGLGSVEDERTPKLVHTLKEHVIIDIAGGHGHSIVLSDKGHVYSFGSSVFGQLGNGGSVKSSVPVLVKGINGRVTSIATGYFHNLALTDGNSLYTWGTSPQSLRLQAQAHKRSRLLQSQNNGLNSPTGPSDSEPPKTITDGNAELQGDDVAEVGIPPLKPETDLHLSPTLVDTRNVTGKIVQMSCGCHHSALVTESGDLYTWGRSLDGQLGNGGQREVVLPSLISVNSFKVDAVSCGCEFTTVQEKQTGKIHSWGSNSLGQLGIPVKDSATKTLDGKLIMLKSCKRLVRIPHMGTNSFDTPKRVPDIPSASFTYHTLNSHSNPNTFALSGLENGSYSHKSLHYVIEKYHNVLNMSGIMKKCLDCGNYQAASKIALLQNKIKQSMIYQLKALQNTAKYRPKVPCCEKPEGIKDGTKTPKSELMTPDSEIHLFTVQGGHEEMCDDFQSQEMSNSDDDFLDQNGFKAEDANEEAKENDLKLINEPELENDSNQLKTEYVDHAKYIVDKFLEFNSKVISDETNQCSVLETGIQFWTAEKLPMTSLEDFLLERLDNIFYDLGCLLFCRQKKENQAPLLHHFSSSFLLTVTSKILAHIEKNESCIEYLETMSKILLSDKSETKQISENKKGLRGRTSKSKKHKSEKYVEAITEKLKKQWTNENFVNVSYRDIVGDCIYLFSCGHWHSPKSLKEECKALKEINDGNVSEKVIKLYEDLDCEGHVDLACPLCVSNYLKQ